MRSSIFFYNDITELDEEQRDEITFEFWLEEMISFTESDDTSTGSTRQRRPKCGTGQSDRAMSVLAHEPRRAALRMQLHGTLYRATDAKPVVPL